jgi:uncharacterized protein
MKDRTADSRTLNVQALCRDSGQVAGLWPLAGMSRLAQGLYGESAANDSVHWSAQGSLRPASGGDPELWLHLRASAVVTLQCQRCLQALLHPLLVDRRFRFVRTEAEAERMDEKAEDDVLVLTPRMRLDELVEDELILALPLVPRHEAACPSPLPLPVDDLEEDAPAPNPFASLAALRPGKGRPQ